MRRKIGSLFLSDGLQRGTILSVLCVALLSVQTAVYALPFNDDLVNNQLKTGQYSRVKPAGVISRGALSGEFPLYLEKKADTQSWNNPKKDDDKAIGNGRRLYQVNCTPCHGNLEKVPYEAGVAGKLIGAPDLTSDMYYSQRTDGSIYGTIHFGGMALMPGYGWKLSPSEHWDIVSYVRSVQKARNPK